MLRKKPRTMADEQQIAASITEQVNAAHKISGAQLGFVLTSRFPDFRQKFGTLRSFVEKFCTDTVGVIPPTEKGDVFYVPASMLSSMQAEAPKPLEPEPAWRAFTAPKSPSRICINTESGDFRVGLKTDPEPAVPWVAVPSVSPEDHRRIASEFLTEIPEEDRSGFQDIVNLPNFWQPWVARLGTFQQGKYSKGWAVFRFNKLCALFLDRLKSIGVEERLAAVSLQRLKALKSASRDLAHATVPKSPATAPSNCSTRNLAITALEEMSENELRQVWLPLGPVADAIRKSHSR